MTLTIRACMADGGPQVRIQNFFSSLQHFHAKFGIAANRRFAKGALFLFRAILPAFPRQFETRIEAGRMDRDPELHFW